MGVQRMSADGEPTASHGCGWLCRVILSADEPQMKAGATVRFVLTEAIIVTKALAR
jgi:hypothetical protein